jgi:hypothetical protein
MRSQTAFWTNPLLTMRPPWIHHRAEKLVQTKLQSGRVACPRCSESGGKPLFLTCTYRGLIVVMILPVPNGIEYAIEVEGVIVIGAPTAASNPEFLSCSDRVVPSNVQDGAI